MSNRNIYCWTCLIALLSFAAMARADEALQFNRDIRPILSDTCFKCHGFDKRARKGDLRLDTAEASFAPAKHGTPIVPGHPEQSEVFKRMTAPESSDEHMPPAAMHQSLSPRQIELVKKWIEQGAVYQPHWALIRPQMPAIPSVRQGDWPRNEVDNFILARLEAQGLSPSPEAEKRTLLRRVTLDLTGLPPTPAEIAAFLADHAPDAYEKVVDRLLASPHYGERMVLEWLDAARYADTNGYQADPTRTVWPWRDWVISAMNGNMPFDQFTVEQIAGDLLPNATTNQKLATCFSRNHPYNGEGGRIPEETRVENVLDRVDTMSTTFLGLTLGCAKCHDHKFDPVTQKDYYSLYAYFNRCSESGQISFVNGGNPPPVLAIATPEQAVKLASLRGAESEAKKKLDIALPQIDSEQARWEQTVALGASSWIEPQFVSATSEAGATMKLLEDGSILVGGINPANDVHTVVLRTDLSSVTAIRVQVLPDASLPQGGPGRSTDSGNFVLTNLEATATSLIDPSKTSRLSFSGAEATYSQGGWLVTGAIDTDPQSGWAVWNAPDKQNVMATFRLSVPAGYTGGTELQLRFIYGSGPHKQHTMGRFKISMTTGLVGTPETLSALAVSAAQRNDAQKKQVRDFYRASVSPIYHELNETAAATKKAADDFDNSLTKVPVMDDATARESHVLSRGLYDKPLDKVVPGVPAAISAMPPGQPANRLGLARWLVDPANPLVSRVIVNRYWQSFFGTGIVKTADDFGTQGEPPSHPELMDYLAVRFMQSGWNVKALHRLIVCSATYRQSSRVSPELLERDPANRLLARGPRYRMTCFQIRDQALAASGLLVDSLGGPPVKPYQPPGVWEEMSLGQIQFQPDTGDKLYRRTLYTFWRRTVAPTIMFDVSPRTVCMVRAPRTNTPLQALALMNDTTYVEAARMLSESLLRDKMANDPQRLDNLFVHLMSRPARDAERPILLGALARLRSQYQMDPASATKLVAVGAKAVDPSLNPQELAAWTALVNTVMNMDETITKE